MTSSAPPAPALAPYIESYWTVRPDDGPVDLRVDVFVDGRADLLFHFGAPYTRRVMGGPAVTLTESNLDAQRLVPIRIRQRGRVESVGVRFRLGGVGPFAVTDLRRFTNATPRQAGVFGTGAEALQAGLRGATLEEAAARLDPWFCARLRADGARAGGERALAAPHDSHGCTLADLAHGAGSFDQARFIRDVRRRTGGVLRGYRGYHPEAGPHDFAPDVVAFVHEP